MKTRSKLIAVAIVVTAMFFTTKVNAQTNPANAWRIGIGVETGIPTGNYSFGANFILGGTIRLQYGVSNSFALTLTSGAYHFFPKDIPGTNTPYQSFGLIPIKGGIKWFYTPGLYFGAEAGVGLEETDAGGGPKRFLWSPVLGWASQHWDVGVHYDGMSAQTGSNGIVALRLAYGFGLEFLDMRCEI